MKRPRQMVLRVSSLAAAETTTLRMSSSSIIDNSRIHRHRTLNPLLVKQSSTFPPYERESETQQQNINDHFWPICTRTHAHTHVYVNEVIKTNLS